jgi:mono/diheme cytochrome c family protein
MSYFLFSPHSAISWTAVMLAVGITLAASLPAQAQDAAGGTAASPTQAQIDAGHQIWTNAGCSSCHGSNGQGGTGGDLPAGPSLRATQLDRAGLMEVISCGRPGMKMPAWLDGAYTEHACYGQGLGAAPQGILVAGTLESQDIENLVDYLLAEIVGK